MDQLGTSKQVGGTIGARGHTGTATNACSMVKGKLCRLVIHVQSVGVGSGTRVHGHITTLLHHSVQGRPVDHHVFDHGECSGTEWFDLKGRTIFDVE